MAVNLSTLQFKTPLDLETDVFAALAAAGLSPGMLELEITESLLMSTSQDNNEFSSGFAQAASDWRSMISGPVFPRSTTCASFRWIASRSRRTSCWNSAPGGDCAGSAAVVKATIGLARELKIDVIAEGVETAEQLHLVTSWACHEAQGYFFARPLRRKISSRCCGQAESSRHRQSQAGGLKGGSLDRGPPGPLIFIEWKMRAWILRLRSGQGPVVRHTCWIPASTRN